MPFITGILMSTMARSGLYFAIFFQSLGTVARCARRLHLMGIIPRDELRHTLAFNLLIVHDQQWMRSDLSFFLIFTA